MPTREDRRLKLVKGAGSPAAGAARPVRRREVTRRTPRDTDPVTAILERLDAEPVEEESAERVDKVSHERVEEESAERVDKVSHERVEEESAERVEASRRRRVPGRRQLVVGALVAALCAALTAAGVFGQRWYADRALEEAHQQALAAARQATVDFVSVSASSVDRDLQRIVDGAAGEFKDEFLRGQSQVRAAVVENKVESLGSALRAALVSGDRRRAVVLVAVDATVKNVNAPDGRLSHYRIQVEMIRDAESGRWQVSRLQFVG